MIKKYKIYKFSILLIFALLTSCVNGQRNSDKYFFQAYECKDLGCQLKFLNKSIEANPKYAPAYYGRGYVYFIQHKHKEKQADLDKANELSPDYGEIIEAYNKALKLFPNNKHILDIQGGLFMIIGSYSKALENYNLAIKLDPKYPQAYLGRGDYYEYQKENEKALEDYAKAIELDPNFATAYFRHGAMLAIVFKDFDKGIAELDKAIELNPDFIAAYNSRAVAYKLQGKYEKAISDLNKSIELDPKNYLIYNFRALVYRELGKIELAEKDEEKAKELETKKNTVISNRN